MKRRLLLLVALLVLAAACQQDDATPTPTIRVITPTPSPTATATPTVPPPPKVFRIGMVNEPTTTNIWNVLGPQATTWNLYTQLNQYPYLYGFSPQRLDWVPAWAEDFPSGFTREGALWTATVRMKQGPQWSDGAAVTAADVAFTVNTALEFQLPGNWATVIDPSLIDGAEAVDNRTVKYYFTKQPGLARWQFGVLSSIFVSKRFWETFVEQAKRETSLEERQRALFAVDTEEEPVAGEVDVVRWERGAFMEASANPRYYFTGSTVTEYQNGAYREQRPGVYDFSAYGEPTGDVLLQLTRGPHVDSVIYSVYGGLDSAVLALRQGDIDYLAHPSGIPRGFQQQLQADRDVSVVSNASNSVRFLAFNTRRAPMDNTAFRQAVALLIDKEFMSGTVLQGAVEPAYAMVPPGNGFWHNSRVSRLGEGLDRETRINEAVALLKSAGFTWDIEPTWDPPALAVTAGEGLRMPNGELVPEMEILSPSAGYDPFRATYTIWVERWLREAGIPVTSTLTGFNVIVPRAIGAQDFDMLVFGINLGVFPDYLRDLFHSSRAGNGDQNFPGYDNAEFDALADTFLEAEDLETARTRALRLQQTLAEELPWIVLFTPELLEPVRNNVQLPFDVALDGLQSRLLPANGLLSYAALE